MASTLPQEGGSERGSPDVALADEDAGVVDALGESNLEDLRLEAAFEEVLERQAEHVIQLHLRLVKHADADETAQQGVAWTTQTGGGRGRADRRTDRRADRRTDRRR